MQLHLPIGLFRWEVEKGLGGTGALQEAGSRGSPTWNEEPVGVSQWHHLQ